jgi:hypothetical protein
MFKNKYFKYPLISGMAVASGIFVLAIIPLGLFLAFFALVVPGILFGVVLIHLIRLSISEKIVLIFLSSIVYSGLFYFIFAEEPYKFPKLETVICLSAVGFVIMTTVFNVIKFHETLFSIKTMLYAVISSTPYLLGFLINKYYINQPIAITYATYFIMLQIFPVWQCLFIWNLRKAVSKDFFSQVEEKN